jgi:ketopantoate reductase
VFGDIDDEHELTALTEFADVIFLGVKPFSLAAVMRRLSEKLKPRQLIVSIAAGWSLAQLEDTLPPGTPVRTPHTTRFLCICGACPPEMNRILTSANNKCRAVAPVGESQEETAH